MADFICSHLNNRNTHFSIIAATSEEPGFLSFSAIVTFPTSWRLSFDGRHGDKWDLGLNVDVGDNYNGGLAFTFKKPQTD